MKIYGLEDYIKPSKASYEAGMAAALGAYKAGQPVFFYTWTPNWTVYKFKPGKDVMWINVPEKGDTGSVVSGVTGAVSDPCVRASWSTTSPSWPTRSSWKRTRRPPLS